MKALTVRQPWASLIVRGVKAIETRSWPLPNKMVGQRIAIHAGAHDPSGETPLWPSLGSPPWRWDGTRWEWTGVLGAIVGHVTLTGCLPILGECVETAHISNAGDSELWQADDTAFPGSQTVRDISDQLSYGDYTPGRYGWILTDPEPCDPIPAKGRLGFWDWEPPA